jgi:hypothetical protein
MCPTSTPNIFQMVQNIHMHELWVNINIHHHDASTTLVGPEVRSCWPNSSWVTALATVAVVEAPDSHGVVPSSSPDIYNMFEIINVLWMGTGIHHHAIITTFV